MIHCKLIYIELKSVKMRHARQVSKVPKIMFSPEQIHGMIGLRVIFQDTPCRIVEILDDGPHLILECIEKHKSIQPDQHGEAHRRVPQTFTIPILTPEKTEFSGEFLTLVPED